MPKIANGAVITKCGECKRMFTGDGRSLDKWFCAAGTFRPVNPDTIDPQCPLQECEVIENKGDDIRNGFSFYQDGDAIVDETVLEICLPEKIKWQDISHIIIVKKSNS